MPHSPAKLELIERVKNVIAREKLTAAKVRERATTFRATSHDCSQPDALRGEAARLASAWKQCAQQMERSHA